MPRPQKERFVCCQPRNDSFSPGSCPHGQPVMLTVDEYEAVRLIDLENCTQEECAAQMRVSRTTVQGIYSCARWKIADALVNGKKLIISGGDYATCKCCGEQCGRGFLKQCSNRSCRKQQPGGTNMNIAVAYENGNIFQHFGRTEQFKIYEIKDGKIAHSEIIGTMGNSHGALAGFLSSHKVDTLICGGIGGGAQQKLSEAGIRLFGGVSGSADEAVTNLLAGKLSYDPDVHCEHHDREHGDEGHSCGDHGCENSRKE